ncbi:MAG: hypothetical protein D6732_16295 [Methanobacteriota archaeon]|nr:MAG: hypothetical protein D6732_16295 [Euryarchaeota archaeon]
MIPLRGELYPINCKHIIPIQPQDLRVIEYINKIIGETGDKISPPENQDPLLKQILSFLLPENAFHELGNSHYHVIVSKKGEIVAFFAKKILPNVLEHILRLNHLRALSIQLGNVIFDDLEKWLTLKPIEFLHIESDETVFSDNLQIANMPYLKHLSISFKSSQPLDIQGLNSLVFLSINGPDLTLHELPSLKTFCINDLYSYTILHPKKFRSLATIAIRNAYDLHENTWLQELPNLQELYVHNSPIAIETISNLSLKTLSITDVLMPVLDIPPQMELKHLIINRCRVQQIKNLPPSLETLDLANNLITQIPPLTGFDNLQILSLQDNRIDGENTPSFFPPSLRMVNLQGNPIKFLNQEFLKQLKGIPVVLLPGIIPNSIQVSQESA